MPRMTKAEKAIEKQVEDAFKTHASCVQFDVMDLSKIMNACRDAAKAGQSVDVAMIAAIAKYRRKSRNMGA